MKSDAVYNSEHTGFISAHSSATAAASSLMQIVPVVSIFERVTGLQTCLSSHQQHVPPLVTKRLMEEKCCGGGCVSQRDSKEAVGVR